MSTSTRYTSRIYLSSHPEIQLLTLEQCTDTFSYIDPDSPNPRGGIHPAYSDFQLRRDPYGSLTPHGTRLSALILGDLLGQAQKCRFTVVKLPQYTNSPRAGYSLFPLFSVRDAISMMKMDIVARKSEGEERFVISSPLGYPFGSDAEDNPVQAQKNFVKMWNNFLDWLNSNSIAIISCAGNSRNVNPTISLIPARLFRNPEMVVGSVTPNALAHPMSQGSVGDNILTAYAPGPGALVVSSDPSGAYMYEWTVTDRSALTSYACGFAVGYAAQMLADGYSGNSAYPPTSGEQPNAYAYRMMSSLARPRVAGGPPIIYNGAPQLLYQDCGGPGGYRKRDGSCPLTNIELPTGTAALPASVSAAIMAGNGGQIDGTATGVSPSISAAINGIIGAIEAGVSSGHTSSTLVTTTSPLLSSTSPFSSSAPQAPTTTSTPASIVPAPSPSPNAGIAIWLQQYSSVNGAEVDTWFAYEFTPGDTKFGSPCTSDGDGSTPVPDGTLLSNELKIYPSSMSISAYGKKMKYESFLTTIGALEDASSADLIANCETPATPLTDECDSQHKLILRLTCEWVN